MPINRVIYIFKYPNLGSVKITREVIDYLIYHVICLCQRRDDGLRSRVLGSVQTQQHLHQPQLSLAGQ